MPFDRVSFGTYKKKTKGGITVDPECSRKFLGLLKLYYNEDKDANLPSY